MYIRSNSYAGYPSRKTNPSLEPAKKPMIVANNLDTNLNTVDVQQPKDLKEWGEFNLWGPNRQKQDDLQRALDMQNGFNPNKQPSTFDPNSCLELLNNAPIFDVNP